jgi:hypothetical protein
VTGEPLGLEPGIRGGLLDQPGDGLVGQLLSGDPAGLADGAEQRAFGPGEGAGGPVEIGRLAAEPEPSVERGGGAEAGIGWVGPDRDALALAMLVGLRPGDGEQRARRPVSGSSSARRSPRQHE